MGEQARYELVDVLHHIEQSGMTAAALAQASHIDKGTISRIIRGITKNPNGRTINRLAAAAGLASAETEQLEFDLQRELIETISAAVADQFRQIRVELQRCPEREEIAGMVGLFIRSERGRKHRIFKQVFRLARAS